MPRRTTDAAGATPLDGVDLILADLDGVVYAGAQAIPHAVEALNRAQRSIRVGYLTNNASRTTESVAAHLRELGLTVVARRRRLVAAGGGRAARRPRAGRFDDPRGRRRRPDERGRARRIPDDAVGRGRARRRHPGLRAARRLDRPRRGGVRAAGDAAASRRSRGSRPTPTGRSRRPAAPRRATARWCPPSTPRSGAFRSSPASPSGPSSTPRSRASARSIRSSSATGSTPTSWARTAPACRRCSCSPASTARSRCSRRCPISGPPSCSTTCASSPSPTRIRSSRPTSARGDRLYTVRRRGRAARRQRSSGSRRPAAAIDILRAGTAAVWGAGVPIYALDVDPGPLSSTPVSRRMTDAEVSSNHGRRARHEPSALLSRLRVIEDQPLDDRAAALAQVHDELQGRARGGGSGPTACLTTARARLDAELVRRGLARSRALAVEAIQAGLVSVDGVTAVKASHEGGSGCGARPRRRRPLREPRRPQAHRRRSTPSRSTRPAASRSTPAPRRAGSPRCCWSAAPRSCLAVDVGHGQLASRCEGEPAGRERRGRQHP